MERKPCTRSFSRNIIYCRLLYYLVKGSGCRLHSNGRNAASSLAKISNRPIQLVPYFMHNVAFEINAMENRLLSFPLYKLSHTTETWNFYDISSKYVHAKTISSLFLKHQYGLLKSWCCFSSITRWNVIVPLKLISNVIFENEQ